uniref:PHB domain-containing protein n=1 Tax=Panagrellus redivivus TaxID=6233 RepID=A0A7E4WBK2_PANRE
MKDQRDVTTPLNTVPEGMHTVATGGGGISADGDDNLDILGLIFVFASYIFVIVTFPLSMFCVFKVVRQYERGIILRLGKLHTDPPLRPGLWFLLPFVDKLEIVDVRTRLFTVPKQQVLTKDAVPIFVDAVVYTRTNNPIASLLNVSNVHLSVELLCQTTIRSVLSNMELAEILTTRDLTAEFLQAVLNDTTCRWGVKVERFEFRDIVLPESTQHAITAESDATRESRTKILQAESEEKAATYIRRAALSLADAPGAMQLKSLQTLTDLAMHEKSTVVVVPIDLLGNRSN